MRELLGACGWEIEGRAGPDASRRGILSGWEELIDATGPGDAALVFYSGHGARDERPDAEERVEAGLDPYHRYLVPVDIDESTATDFRGLLSEELAVLLRRLTDRFRDASATPNATVILDCCHAGFLVRTVGASIRADPRKHDTRGIPPLLAAAAARQPEPDGQESNPWAVRLAACRPEEVASENRHEDGRTYGLFTAALVAVLNELGAEPVSWTTVMALIGERVGRRSPDQHPRLEGAGDREPFGTAVLGRAGSVPVVVGTGEASIPAATLFGLQTGDRLRLEREDGEPLGSANVRCIAGSRADLAIDVPGGVATLPPGVRAVPLAVALPRRSVRLALDGDQGARVAARVDASTHLAVEHDPRAPVFATVADDAGLVVLDEAGARMQTQPFPPDDGIALMVELLERLAAARRLRDLPSGTGPAALPEPVDVALATIRGGVRQRRAPLGERLRVGERVSVILRNRSRVDLYAWVFDIGISGRVELLTNAAPDGTRLASRFDPDAGHVLWGEQGSELQWPASIPTDPGPGVAVAARPECFLVILADRPQDLGALATRDDGLIETSGMTPLAHLLRNANGNVRADSEPPTLRYRIERLEFLLEPT